MGRARPRRLVAAPLDRRGGEGRGIPIPGPLGPDARSTVPRDGAGDPAARHNPEQGGAGENRPRMTLDVTLPSHGFTPLSTQRLHRLGDVPASRVHLPMQTVTSMLLGGVEYASGEARARASHTSGWRPHDTLTTRGQPRALQPRIPHEAEDAGMAPWTELTPNPGVRSGPRSAKPASGQPPRQCRRGSATQAAAGKGPDALYKPPAETATDDPG
jgi:hypothetical protein